MPKLPLRKPLDSSKCDHFDIEELICPEILYVCSEIVCWRLISNFAKRGLDRLRDDLGQAIYINSVSHGFYYSGVRNIDCKIGAKYSKHKEGTTFDLKTFDKEALIVLYDLIIANWKDYSVVRLEDPELTMKRGWLHVQFGDCSGMSELDVFNP